MPPLLPRLRSQAPTIALLALAACSEPPPPPYTRLEGPAPAVDGLPAGAVLVAFWASWCPPCRAELPALRALARQPPRGVTVLTLGEDEPEEASRAFFQGAPPPELDYRRDLDRQYATAFGVDALPTAILVRDGRFVARFDGPQDWASPGMRRLLAKLAGGGAPPTQQGRPVVDAARGAQ